MAVAVAVAVSVPGFSWARPCIFRSCEVSTYPGPGLWDLCWEYLADVQLRSIWVVEGEGC